MSLSAYHYSGTMASPTPHGKLPFVSNIRLLWGIPGGAQAVEFNYDVDPITAYDFYVKNIGDRIVIADQFFDYPVAEGWIYGVALSPAGCSIMCRGPWFRHFDLFDDTAYPLTDTSSAILKASLTNFVPIISDDQDNIEETSFALDTDGTWELSNFGLYPGDLIPKLAAMSNSDLNQWNYWVRSAPFVGLTPQKPVAYFQEQVDDGSFNWQIFKRDIGRSGMTQNRNIEELANRVLIMYRDIDSNEHALTVWASDADSQSRFWTREAVISGGQMVPDGADQYRDFTLAKLKAPMLQNQLTITAPYILDSGGSRWPLWYPIKTGGGYLRINDLYPDTEIFSTSWDRKRIGQMMTLEYVDAENSLRVILDTEDSRVDALLAFMAATGA